MTAAALRALPAFLALAAALACQPVFAASTTSTTPPAARPAAQAQLLSEGCRTLADEVAAVPGHGPLFLQSYRAAPGQPPLAPALRHAAFVYDNALAGIALLACGRTGDARRIADALVDASGHDRYYHDGRLRNAYRAGPLGPGPAALPGWWDAKSRRWFEDGYQTGTATGNVAWAALMLLAAYHASHDRRYLDAAAKMMGWVDSTVYDATAPAGYNGGYFGEEPTPLRQTWKSTEHNVDAYAAFHWLARLTGQARWRTAADRARGFVAAMWQGPSGRFVIGTQNDGHTLNTAPSALDATLWPLIAIGNAPPEWERALAWAKRHHRIDGGYGFKADPDGLWTEGTGQAALVLQLTGHPGQAAPLWPILLAQRSPAGLLFATPEQRISTGLSIGPTSKTNDFYYFHLPHLGATAWAVLAAARWNPFVPQNARPAVATSP
ncbi:hypothetical protein PATSB16_14600 [Pandoraea thiooxydans]|uniref:hypothetical protein n=1 Tax=Pandoraea thiooxydans TaxID=445709 RepID=UPI00094A2338|nr:hypothetical protein PATSB16_14600 [Pandoraea thiooxydans]